LERIEFSGQTEFTAGAVVNAATEITMVENVLVNSTLGK